MTTEKKEPKAPISVWTFAGGAGRTLQMLERQDGDEETVKEKIGDSQVVITILDLDPNDPNAVAKAEYHSVMSFKLEYTNPYNGKKYDAHFHARRLTIGDQGRIKVQKAILNGGVQIDADADMLHYTFAYLQQVLIEPIPPYFRPSEMTDDEGEIVEAVYRRVRAWQDSFRNKSLGKRSS